MRLLLLISFILLFSSLQFAQTDIEYNMDSVVVTATRKPSYFYEVGRSIRLLNQKQIQLIPATNVYDLLDQITGVDIKQRGPEGVQADVSIRGGNFEQSLILIDGIKLIDPQTGHHNLNLPISLNQIERIEILKGQGSRTYGANAFSGAINLITRKSGNDYLSIDASGGDHKYYKLNASAALNISKFYQSVSATKTKSDGYRYNTGFENINLSYNNSLKLSGFILNSIYGYTEKDFGANSFYSTSFPDQAEKTKTHFAAISSDIDFSSFIFKPKFYWRKNEDEFLLNRFNPSFYKNNHETNVYGGELEISTNRFGGNTSIGVDFSKDEIESNNLGQHERTKLGFFVEQEIHLTNNFNVSLGGFAYKYSSTDWNFWPGVDIAYNLLDNLKLYTNFGRAFRIPSYTELYYSDPKNLGDPNLYPEESANFEFGLDFMCQILNTQIAYFSKNGTNLIDYVLDPADSIWKAQNFTEIKTTGFEASLNINLFNLLSIFNNLKIDYTYLNSDKIDLGQISKYTLDHLKHDVTVTLFHKLPFGIRQTWSFNFEDRVILEDHYTLDTKLIKDFYFLSMYLNVSNLLDETYEEIPGVPLPGRWIIGGIKLTI